MAAADATPAGGTEPVRHSETVNGVYAIVANQVEVLCRPPLPPADRDKSVITIMATGELSPDGHVDLRGSHGIRITTGPAGIPETYSESTNGVEIIVFEDQSVTIQRGLIPGDQKIEMTPDGITIDAGARPLKLKSFTEITLSVAEGTATVSLGPQGVTIRGPIVQIN